MNNQAVYDFALIFSGVFLAGGIVYFIKSNEFKNLISELKSENISAENYSEMQYNISSSIVNPSTLNRELKYIKFSEESKKIANDLNVKSEGVGDFLMSLSSIEKRRKRIVQIRRTTRKSETVWTKLFEPTPTVFQPC